jgi:hypothetical protein
MGHGSYGESSMRDAHVFDCGAPNSCQMRKTTIKGWVFLILTIWFLPPASAQEQPLPDFDTLWHAMKPYLMGQYDQTEILKGYTYRRHSFLNELGKGDTIKKSGEFESEVYYLITGRSTN